MRHEISHSLYGWPTWTINPDILLANPFPPDWGVQHLSLTPTGITFIKIPNHLTVAPGPWRAFIPPQPYFLIEADPDEETNTWETRTWVNHHPLDTPAENYLLALTVHAATTEPFHRTSIGPADDGAGTIWETAWKNQTRNSLPHPALMTYYQFHRHTQSLTSKLEFAERFPPAANSTKPSSI